MDQESVSYYAFRLAGAIAPHIPTRLGYRLVGLLGATLCRLSPLRCNVEDNIAHIVGQPVDSPRVRRLACQVFRNQSKNYFDLLRLQSLSAHDLRQTVPEVTGLGNLDYALAHGRGAVLVSAHFGNFDLAGQILALHGYRLTAVAEHLRPERLFQYVRRTRESHGLSFIPVDGSLRPIFRALRANEIVGLAMDRNVTDAGRLVRFFGRPARLPDGYLRLALRTGAALVVAFCRRLPDDHFQITIEPEVELARSDDEERDVDANMPRVLSILEARLRRYPDQWVYFQPMWQVSPPGAGGTQRPIDQEQRHCVASEETTR